MKKKTEPDSKKDKDGKIIQQEDRIALTSKDIVKKHKEEYNETLTSKQLLENRLYPLINQGYIDSIKSVLDGRANIYFPIITSRKYIILFDSGKSNKIIYSNDNDSDTTFLVNISGNKKGPSYEIPKDQNESWFGDKENNKETNNKN